VTPRWPARAAALLGLLWYLQLGGLQTLSVTNIDWLLTGDWLQHLLGWLMFRLEPWTLPLGTLSGAPYPVGSTIGFTDSNPLLSVLLKPLSPWLPENFQFIGLWLATCFALQGYWGAKLTSLVTDDPWQQTFGGFLFALTPVLIARVQHDTLCAHWMLLALLYAGLRTARAPHDGPWPTSRALAAFVALVAVSPLVHPYLAAMCWTLTAAALATFWSHGRISAMRAGLALATGTSLMVALLALFGYLGRSTVAGVGFGDYSADLTTFFNPDIFSRWLPAPPMRDAQMEGFAYLGLGGLVALVCAVVVGARERRLPGRRAWPILLASALLAIYALSGDVALGGRTVLDLNWLYAPLMPLVAPFRSSGRFIWPAHYLLLLFGVWGVVRLFGRQSRQAATPILALLVAVQASDIHKPDWASPKEFRQVPSAELRPLTGQYRHVVLVPMQVFGVCQDWNPDYVFRFMLQAYRMKATFNSGIYARVPADEIRAACQALEADIAAGRLNRETLYAVAVDRVPDMRAAGAACGRFTGDWLCVSRDSDPNFVRYMER
jgi:hypothetical protein